MRAELQRLKRDTRLGGCEQPVREGRGRAGKRSRMRRPRQPTRASGSSPSGTGSHPFQALAQAVAAANGGKKSLWKIARPCISGCCVGCGGLYYRSHRTQPLTEKDTIVLADFANRTGDPVFDDTLKTALSVSLNQSPFFNVLRKQSRDDFEADDPAARHKAHSRRCSGVVPAGGQQGVHCRIDCKPGQRIRARPESGELPDRGYAGARASHGIGKEKVLDALGQTASKLRGELGESLVTVQKFDVSLQEATTSSLEALQAYSAGRKAYGKKGPAAALPAYQRAVQLDPNFAMGYLAVASGYAGLGEVGRADEYFTKAFELREHASEREKLAFSSAYYENVTGELEKATQIYQEWIGAYPRDPMARLDMGNVYAEQGQYEKAAESYRECLRLDPQSGSSYGNLSNSLLALQRFDEAQQIILDGGDAKAGSLHHPQCSLCPGVPKGGLCSMADQQRGFRASRRWKMPVCRSLPIRKRTPDTSRKRAN